MNNWPNDHLNGASRHQAKAWFPLHSNLRFATAFEQLNN